MNKNIKEALKLCGKTEADLAGRVLCVPYNTIIGIHRQMMPVEHIDRDISEDDIICAVSPMGQSSVYADGVVTIVSFDSTRCPRPDILHNPKAFEFYSDAAVAKGSPDFEFCHSKQAFTVLALGETQSIGAWEKWYNSIIPEEFRESFKSSTAHQLGPTRSPGQAGGSVSGFPKHHDF